ncbi:hypothetical protein J3R30DRAFT_1571855 [Lentinula aciculospora]|uniref:Uncharacterized protein n=1 Tax=Lentinula aciculospora TaxID=153920 RepID=A0A9W9DHL8_9AGAR|nr:hypothetical protein J3R30DRAFT_1571855 [Lentinula aciculospora]
MFPFLRDFESSIFGLTNDYMASPTTPSLDALSDLNYSLLSESLSLDTISVDSFDSIPPFPSRCVHPLSTFLTVNNTVCTKSQLNTLPNSIASIPTPPRLRTLLKEELCISRWTESLRSAEAPGHTPWGEVEDNNVMPWKPEGSLYAGDAFQQALSKSRQRPVASPARQRLPGSNPHHRNALVFEREITLKSEGRTKRWSVQVPAGSMNPDVVDMMVELRNLNSYFKEEEKDNMQANASKEKPEELSFSPVDGVYTHPPSLIVSNSQCVIPLSLESAGSLHIAPKTLAVRRGNKSLAPLSIKSEAVESSTYPSIPTAFLGSPSSYCPTFEFAGKTRSSTAFQDMIDSLRSQCASLQVKTPHCPALQEEENLQLIQASLPDPPPSSNVGDGDDEWAFAGSLLEKFPEFGFKLASDRPVIEERCEGISSESDIIASGGTALDVTQNELTNANTPSPSIAGSVSPTFSSNSPRGILKRCKSVRFAEAPFIESGSVDTAPVQEVVSPPICHSTGPSNTRSLKRPSPLRHTYASQTKATTPSPSCVLAVDRQEPETTNPTSSAQHLKRTAITNLGAIPFPNKLKTQTPSSLGRSFCNTLVSGKENKKVKSKASSLANRYTMDENALRRASDASNPPETLKSRMPVPLRNILTRFR